MTAYSPSVVVGVRGWTPGNVGHFEIDLGKFGLSVLAAIFVAETLGELVIFVDRARANEKLFRLLR